MKKENCVINRATVQDAELLAELAKRTYLEHFSSLWGTERLKTHLVENFEPSILAAQLADTRYHAFLIAFVGHRPVGYVQINWQRHDPITRRPGAELQKIFVDSRITGRGIGTRLLRSSVLLAREAEEEVLWLQVLTDSDAAQRLYRRFGFATIGQVPFSTDVLRTNLEVMVFNLAANTG